jgi:hypothetical protein
VQQSEFEPQLPFKPWHGWGLIGTQDVPLQMVPLQQSALRVQAPPAGEQLTTWQVPPLHQRRLQQSLLLAQLPPAAWQV